MIGALRKPNILHIVTDDQSYRTITAEAMPYFVTEPGGNWVTFPNAVITTPLCHPLRASMITGQRSDHHGRDTNNAQPPPFAESATAAPWLSAAGYHCGLVGKYLNGYPWSSPAYLPPGWDSWFAATGDAGTYFGWSAVDTNLTATTGTTGEYFPDVLSGRVVTFIQNAPTTQPWFCYYAPITPHNPWDVAARHTSLVIADETPPNFNEADVSDKPAYIQGLALLTQAEQDAAHGHRKDTKRMLRALDEGLADIFAAIRARGDWDNTIIIFHTDNGYPYGEHRRHTGLSVLPKGVPYRWCVDPQLRIRYPGVRARSETRPVTTCDLTATWLSAARATATITQDGASLERILCEQPVTWRTQAEAYYVGSGGIPRWYAAIRGDGKKLVRYPTTGEFELYDWNSDPDELANAQASNTATVTAMDSELSALITNSLYWLDTAAIAPVYGSVAGAFLPFY